jgi:enterochelin esterase-like enzyme
MNKVQQNYVGEKIYFPSSFLKRTVVVDTYFPQKFIFGAEIDLLIFNDGQILAEMDFNAIINGLKDSNSKKHLLVAGVHAGEDRLMEYGTAGILNYKGQGAKASYYTQFIMKELIAYLYKRYPFVCMGDISIAGFSLGGLSALDIAWNNPSSFKNVGMFSASFWWRSKSLEKDYNEGTDRIMHSLIRNGKYQPHLKFFFQCGTDDEKMDRNNNGVIDSVDDTQDLIKELIEKGYTTSDIHYSLIEDGQHNAKTWAEVIPEFLKWGWSEDVPVAETITDQA